MAMTESEILTLLHKNFDPMQAAGEDFYVDCTDVRGGVAFARKLHLALSEADEADPEKPNCRHYLFSGHVGGGKSSELKALQRILEKRTPDTGYKRFFPVFVDMREYLDDFDASHEELLLAIVAELAYSFEQREGIILKEGYLTQRVNELRGYLLSEVEVNEAELELPGAKAKITRLKTSPEARKKVREALKGKTSTLLSEINLAFIEARTALRNCRPRQNGAKYADFVLIVDGLDRLYGYGDRKTTDESQRALFVDDSPILLGLKAHCVFTIALSAMRAAEQELTNLYGNKPFLLAMVKTEQRGREHSPYVAGRERLKTLIEQRLTPNLTLEKAFETSALDFMIEYSGGHIRDLLRFARESTLYGERKLPITLRSVQKAVSENISFHNPKEGEEDWKRLAELELSETQEWQTQKPDERRLLEQLYVMEYINGGEEDIFNDTFPWYAVHPIVRKLRPFLRAVEAKKNTPAEN
ncbi:MAG: hypothetical protein SFU56_16270 [Capsulimonadales bacterium]|nr:hypothetical protein [Capsulimonadales bacterium]